MPCWLCRALLQSGLEARAKDGLPLPHKAMHAEYTTVEYTWYYTTQAVQGYLLQSSLAL
jgi:hypothetical protein